MTYIDRDELITELKVSALKTYFYLGLIDESVIYPIIDNCLSTLKCKTSIVKPLYLNVNSFKAELPEDFFKLKSIIKCESYKFTHTNPSIQIDYEPVLCTQRPCEEPLVNCDGSKYYLNQKFERFVFEVNDIQPLKVEKNSRNKCCKGFTNEGSETVSIQNNYINTEFCNGIIYITYESTENDGMIPDNPKIKEAIKNICIYESFKVMYYNGEQDIFQRMQHSEQKASIAYNILYTFAKGNELDKFLQFKQSLINRYNIFDKITRFR